MSDKEKVIELPKSKTEYLPPRVEIAPRFLAAHCMIRKLRQPVIDLALSNADLLIETHNKTCHASERIDR